MFSLFALAVQPSSQPVTPTVIEIVKEPRTEISMIEVALAAFGLTGLIMVAAIIAGFIAGGAFIWYRRRRPASTIEARGHEHNFFRV